jgi:glycolate oxidase FAD binding subunit
MADNRRPRKDSERQEKGKQMRPANEAELAEVVRGADGPLCITGGGTRAIGRRTGMALDTSALSGISLYEPGALTLVAGAGTPLVEVEAALAAEGQRLPFEVPDLRALLGREGVSTLGGVVAANASGPRRVQVGACRDSLIGVRFVDGRGTVIKNGGRVMKNVTGLDLVKLMAGSHGTLGVLTEVAFKLLSRPEAEATLVARGVSAGEGIAALSRALGSPFDVSGAGYLPMAGEVVVRIEGLEASVAYRAGALQRLLGPGWDIVTGAASAALWRELRDVTPLAGLPGALWRVSVKPGDAPRLLARLGTDRAVCDWGGGLIWLLMEDESGASAARLRGEVATLGGHATRMRGGPADAPVFPPETPAVAALTAGLRAAFDPRGVFNPGLMA